MIEQLKYFRTITEQEASDINHEVIYDNSDHDFCQEREVNNY